MSFEGRWQKVRQEVGGNETPAAVVSKSEILIEGNKLTNLFNGNKSTMADITFDASTSPKTIDIKYTAGPAGTSYGIYRFTEDGQLEICVNQPTNKVGDPRPTEFGTKPGTKGAGSILWVFKKEK